MRFSYFSRLIVSAAIVSYLRLKAAHRKGDPLQAARLALRAAHVCPSLTILKSLEKILVSAVARIDLDSFNWDAVFPDSRPTEIAKAVILKPPISFREKGVLLIAFEAQWLRLLRYGDLKKIAQRYHIVLAPTWSPPHDIPLLLFSRMWPDPFFVFLSNFADGDAFRRIAPNCIPVNLLSSNWVNPDSIDTSEPVEKEFDIVVLANFAGYKRHFLLFKALRSMSPKTKVLLLGRQMDGRTESTIMKEADVYGVADRITMRPGLPDKEMFRALRSAKISFMPSGNEGSCVAITESLFADVPVVMFADARVGSRAFINDQTGRLISYYRTGKQLEAFIAEAHRCSPRKWAIENGISCFESTELLNQVIRTETLRQGEEWTLDIAVHHFRPNPTYVHTEDLLRSCDAYEEFALNFGCSIVRRSPDGVPIADTIPS